MGIVSVEKGKGVNSGYAKTNETLQDKVKEVKKILNETRTLYHGANPDDKSNKEYIVHTNYDDGRMKTRTLAKSAEEARDLVHKSEPGSPKSAHKILVKDNPERTAEEVKKIFDNGKRKVHVGIVSKNKKGESKALY